MIHFRSLIGMQCVAVAAPLRRNNRRISLCWTLTTISCRPRLVLSQTTTEIAHALTTTFGVGGQGQFDMPTPQEVIAGYTPTVIPAKRWEAIRDFVKESCLLYTSPSPRDS